MNCCRKRRSAMLLSFGIVAAFLVNTHLGFVLAQQTSCPTPDVTVTALSQDCASSQCFNRLHPKIPMVASAKPGDVILFNTPTSTADVKSHDLLEENMAPAVKYIGTLHQLAGPVEIEGAKAGDKIAIEIRDIEVAEGAWGWNVALEDKGFLSDMVKTGSFNCAL